MKWLALVAVVALGPAGALTSAPAGGRTAAPSAEEPTSVITVQLRAKAMVYSAATGLIYVSTPDTGRGGKVVTLDPCTGTFGPELMAGGEPDRLAMARDGSVIHVRTTATSSLRSFDLAGVVPPYSTAFTEAPPGSMSVQAGNGHVVAVSHAAGRVSIVDHGRILPVSTTALDGNIDRIVFGGTPDHLYGLAGEDDVKVMRTDKVGVRVIATRTDAVNRTLRTLHARGDILYLSEGQVYDPEDDQVLGQLPGLQSVSVAADPRVEVAYGMWAGALHVYDTRSFTKVGALRLPGIANYPKAMTLWGDHGVAVASESAVIILQHPLVGSGAPVPGVPTASPSGGRGCNHQLLLPLTLGRMR